MRFAVLLLEGGIENYQSKIVVAEVKKPIKVDEFITFTLCGVYDSQDSAQHERAIAEARHRLLGKSPVDGQLEASFCLAKFSWPNSQNKPRPYEFQLGDTHSLLCPGATLELMSAKTSKECSREQEQDPEHMIAENDAINVLRREQDLFIRGMLAHQPFDDPGMNTEHMI